MTLEEALQWADVFGPLQSIPPDGDGPALLTLAAEVRRLQAELHSRTTYVHNGILVTHTNEPITSASVRTEGAPPESSALNVER